MSCTTLVAKKSSPTKRGGRFSSRTAKNKTKQSQNQTLDPVPSYRLRNLGKPRPHFPSSASMDNWAWLVNTTPWSCQLTGFVQLCLQSHFRIGSGIWPSLMSGSTSKPKSRTHSHPNPWSSSRIESLCVNTLFIYPYFVTAPVLDSLRPIAPQSFCIWNRFHHWRNIGSFSISPLSWRPWSCAYSLGKVPSLIQRRSYPKEGTRFRVNLFLTGVCYFAQSAFIDERRVSVTRLTVFIALRPCGLGRMPG